jgi:hypothetical protein
MATTLWAKHHYAKCFGKWLVSDPDCGKCAKAEACEKKTKVRFEEADQEPEGSGGVEEVSPVAPLEYLIQSLGGRYDQEKEEKERAVLYKFKDNGKTVIAVAIGVTGKVKIVSVIRNKSTVLEGVQSVEDVESVLREML